MPDGSSNRGTTFADLAIGERFRLILEGGAGRQVFEKVSPDGDPLHACDPGGGVISLILPVPPSGNASYRTGKGRFYRSATAQQYHDTVRLICLAKRVAMLRGPITFEVRWYRARRSGDLDGRLKVLQDALQGVAFENDSNITRIVAERFEDKANPRMEVTITEYQEAA